MRHGCRHPSTARRVTRRAFGATLALVLAGGLSAPAAVALPATEVQSQQWWIERLGLHATWQISEGKGTTVAVIDSGVDGSFGDLRGALVNGFGVGTGGNGRRDTDATLHGTRIADEIAGRGTGFGLLGVARKAKILPVAIPVHSDATTAEALTKLTAMANPPDVVNMSYGGNGQCSPDLQRAVQAAAAKNIILVASAGNDGNGTNAPQTPAGCVGVVAVGAFDNFLQAWAGSQRQSYVALAGPGVKMIGYDKAAASGYGYASGTSDAAAVISATMAVVKAHFPQASARDIVTRVLYTARQFLGAQGSRNDTWGFGVARPHHAVRDSVPANAPNPIYDALDKLGGGGVSSPGPPVSNTPSAGPPGSSVSTAAPSSGTASSVPAAAGDTGSGVSTAVIVAIVVAVLVLVVLISVAMSRRRRAQTGGSIAGQPPPGPPKRW